MAEWLKAHAWKACVRETVPWVRIPLSPPDIIEIYSKYSFLMVDPRIASGRNRVWKASVIRSEIRSRAELNCALPLFLHPSHQRDTAHRPIGTGRLRARRRFGYWREQIGHLRDQSGHHFVARRENSSLQSRVGVETAMENVESTGRPATG